MNPMRAAVERHAERRCIGDTAPADLAGGLEHGEALLGGGDAARGGDAGGAGADNHHVHVAFGRPGAERGLRQQRRTSGQK